MDKKEGQAAFVLLNKIRQNPQSFKDSFPFSVAKIQARPALIWNDTLAAVAERKALDMATRNYIAHVDRNGYGINYHISKAGYTLHPDWLKDKRANFFESINAGAASGEEAVRMLIVDAGVPGLNHRKHLLGMDDWSASLVDIGIGFVRTNKVMPYQSYTCVIIAKHQ